MSIFNEDQAEYGVPSCQASKFVPRTMQGPSAEDWERLRPVIRCLYIDEGRTLKDVMHIMADEYGHRATVKMYKSRFARYGMNKHNRASDMAFIMRSQRNRDRQGKRSSFVIHSKTICSKEIERFIIRKEKQEPKFKEAPADASTPAHIQCLSLPASPSAETPRGYLALHEEDRAELSSTDVVPEQPEKLSRSISCSTKSRETLGLKRTSGVRRESQSLSLPFVITPPDIFSAHELLFTSISNYVAGSSGNETWIIKASKPHTSSSTRIKFNNLLIQAMRFFDNSLFITGRQLASKAFSLISAILREESLDVLETILETFLSLIERALPSERSYPELCVMLQVHIRQLAKTILPVGQLWRNICILICLPEVPEKEIWLRSWRCFGDAMSRTTFKYSGMNVESEANLLHQAYIKDPQSGELHLQRLLTEYSLIPCKAVDTELLIIERLVRAMIFQMKYTEGEMLLENVLASARRSGCLSNYREARLREYLAVCQNGQGKACMAETNLRVTISLFVKVYGWEGPFVVAACALLERWLREWGRQEEADELQARMDEILVQTASE